MRASSLIFYLLYMLNTLLILGAHGVNIQLYKHENFTGLALESRSNGGCNNIPRDKQTSVKSIRTDTCFIAYYNFNCKSWLSEKFLPGDIILSGSQLGKYYWIGSFQTCNEDEGGNQLNLDITVYKNSSKPSKVLESYKNICSCVNVPQYIQNMSIWSIDNHHNALLAYYEPNCSVNKWNPKFIPAGHNDDSIHMDSHKNTDPVTNTTYKIQSFGPDPNSTYFNFQTSNCKLEIPGVKNVELETQVNQLKRNQEKFQSEMLQKHNDDFKKLSDKIAELEQQCRNVTHKIKSDLHKFFA